MKKIISAVLVLTFLLTCAMTSFAADLTNPCSIVGKVSKVENNEFTLSFFLVENGNEGGVIDVSVDNLTWAIGLKFDSSAISLIEAPTLGYGATSGTNSTKLSAVTDSYYLEIETAAETTLALTSEEPIATFKFRLKDGVTSVGDFSLTSFEISDTDFNSVGLDYSTPYSIDKVVIGGSAPAVPEVNDVNTTADGTTFGDYKDIPLFNCAANIKNASKVFIAPELFLNGVSQGTKAKVEIPGLTADEAGANVVIKIAVVGAPEGVVTINPNVTAE